jgi:hypothetical protein
MPGNDEKARHFEGVGSNLTLLALAMRVTPLGVLDHAKTAPRPAAISAHETIREENK